LLRIKYNSNIKIKKRLEMINDLAPKEFQNYLSNNDTVLVDVREQWDWIYAKLREQYTVP